MNRFLQHVKEGLAKTPKALSSRYFYDEIGDGLFQEIMQLEQYYLPACEMQIIQQQSQLMAKDLAQTHKSLQIVELGAGDGSKTKHLLKQFEPYFDALEYVAMDISESILDVNKQEVESEVSSIDISSVAGNYFQTYKDLPDTSYGRLVLFLGANIGNYLFDDAVAFCQYVKQGLRKNDAFIVAFDLVKHPRKIIAAYDDSEGITKAFNLNLLNRMNRELGADFDTSKFEHFPYYNPTNGITESHIVSLEDQIVHFSDGFDVRFEAFEAIHTEISKKYFPKDIQCLSDNSGLKISQTYYNSTKEYAFVSFTRNNEKTLNHINR